MVKTTLTNQENRLNKASHLENISCILQYIIETEVKSISINITNQENSFE